MSKRQIDIALLVAAMIAVVVASNILVQYPVQGAVGGVNLADILTWGAFTYPLAFLVTDLTNRSFGPVVARRVILAGFAIAVALSVYFASPRLAIASGTAFLVGQLLDVTVFNRCGTPPGGLRPGRLRCSARLSTPPSFSRSLLPRPLRFLARMTPSRWRPRQSLG